MLYKSYHVAKTIDDALSVLAASNGSARPIAGGTDLMLHLHEHPDKSLTLVDISRIEALQSIFEQEGRLHIGAAATYAQIRQSPLLAQQAFLLVEASHEVGANQIQNMGTIGGNIANASPAGDLLPCLYVLDAQVHICGAAGSRSLPLAQFITGYRKIDLKADEIIASLSFERAALGLGSAFVKFGARQAQAISIVNAAVVLQVQDGLIVQARVALGAVGPTIVRCAGAEALLLQQQPAPELYQQAAEQVRLAIHPIDDIRGSAAFRRHIAGVIVTRALDKAAERLASRVE
jgi:carbon-monoxide dehydrogenase medium subunit